MKLQIENGLKELKWDRKKNKMIDKSQKERLMMVEDFVVNLNVRASEVYKFCERSNASFNYALPSVKVKDQHSEAYQNTLLYLEGIYQFVEFMVASTERDANAHKDLQGDLTACKKDLERSLKKLSAALEEKDLSQKRCMDIVKQTQMVHAKCKLKKQHYKAVLLENKHLQAKNKIIENELKLYEDKIAKLTENYDNSKRCMAKMKKDLDSYKDKVHKMTIEINLLEKMNVEQAIEDENIKEKLMAFEENFEKFKEHNPELYEHVPTCTGKENCKYSQNNRNVDVSFKYDAAKKLIKRMQLTLKNKSNDLQQKTSEISNLKRQLATERNKPCECSKNLVVDCDGIIEENRRLWDGYFHLQLEQVSMEKDVEISERKRQEIRDKLSQVTEERREIEEENNAKQEKIKEYLELIEELKESHKKLQEKLTQLREHLDVVTSGKERADNELLQLRTFLDQQEETLRRSELKFISLENEYLHAQELLEEYKRSFEKIEELLDGKVLEHEEKMAALSKELAAEKNENDVLVSILMSPLVSRVVNAYIKMEELEECVENMINLKNCQLTTDNLKSNSNYIENNNVIFEDDGEELKNDGKTKLCEELKYKIEDLKVKCEDSVDKIVKNANNKLEKYKMTVFNDDEITAEAETFMSSTYERIKLQMGSVNT